jgi:hypothetical protein
MSIGSIASDKSYTARQRNHDLCRIEEHSLWTDSFGSYNLGEPLALRDGKQNMSALQR